MGQQSVANTLASKESSKLAEGAKKSPRRHSDTEIDSKEKSSWLVRAACPLGLKGFNAAGVNHLPDHELFSLECF